VKKSALDKATLEAYVRHLFLWGPQIKVEIADAKPSPLTGMVEVNLRASAGAASKDERLYVSQDGQKIVQAIVYDVGKNPFAEDLAKLKTEFQPSLGTPGAPVVLVMFSDFQCTYCKEEGKMLRQNLLTAFPKQVRLYFKDMPLVAIHPWAKAAAIAGRCVFRANPTAFWDYHDWIFDQQAQITPETLRGKFLEFAKSKSLDTARLEKCFDTRATEAEVDKSIGEARALGVNSTPTLFVNGRRLTTTVPWGNLKQIIDFEIDYQKTANNAGEEACCEVKLPSPLR